MPSVSPFVVGGFDIQKTSVDIAAPATATLVMEFASIEILLKVILLTVRKLVSLLFAVTKTNSPLFKPVPTARLPINPLVFPPSRFILLSNPTQLGTGVSVGVEVNVKV